MNIHEWYQHTVGDDTEGTVARKAGINQATLWRQRRDGTLSPENLLRIARAYDRPPLEPLLIIGFITQDEIDRSATDHDVRAAASDDIIKELERRLAHYDTNAKPKAARPAKTKPARLPSTFGANPTALDDDMDRYMTVRDAEGNAYRIDSMQLAAKRGDVDQDNEEFESLP